MIQVQSIRFNPKYQIGQLNLRPILVNLTGNYSNLQTLIAALLSQFLLVEFQLTKEKNDYHSNLKLVLIA